MKLGADLHFAYVGTVSEWFDIDTIRYVLEAEPRLHLHLIGPIANVQRAKLAHQRILLHGEVAHAQLAGIVRPFDAFIMPFTRSPLIEGVDPVKLYEYLALSKPVFSIAYPEIERFREYVYFYDSKELLLSQIKAFRAGQLEPKAPRDRVQAFIASNTWKQRALTIDDALRGALA